MDCTVVLLIHRREADSAKFRNRLHDQICDLNYIPNTAIQKQVKYAINNSFGFGGHNVSLIVGRIDDPTLKRSPESI